MNSYQYLAGMTRSESIRFVQSLPGLTPEEYRDLMSAAENKSEHRIASAEYNETLNLRVVYLVNHLKTQPNGASVAEIADALKMNGTNVAYSIRQAVKRGLIKVSRTEKRRKKIYKVTPKALKGWVA